MESTDEENRCRATSGNIFFGYQNSTLPLSRSTIGDACEITLDTTEKGSADLRIFRGKDALVELGVSSDSDVRVYAWGQLAHPTHLGRDLIEWIGTNAARRNWSAYKELVGAFVLVLETLRPHRIHFVADALGTRPFFYALNPGGMIFGSDVWHLRGIDPKSVTLSPDAISSWLVYGFNCAETSLFSEYKRLAPATVLTIENGLPQVDAYLERHDPLKTLGTKEAAETVFGMVDTNVRALSRLKSPILIGLSGGYDSRLILGLVTKQRIAECTAVTIESASNESGPAEMVAKALGVTQEKVRVEGSNWDIYDEPFHFSCDGFPITKQASYQVAATRPGRPVMNGFLGDRVVHGHGTTCNGLDESQVTGSLAEALFLNHRQSTFDSYMGRIAGQIRARAMRPMRRAEEVASPTGDVYRWADLYFRQRLYMSNNFNQHLCFSETLLPFLSGQLIEYYTNAHRSSFSRDVYRQIFRDHLPELADIPHSDEVRKARAAEHSVRPASRRTREFALAVLMEMSRPQNASAFSLRHVVPRMLLAFAKPLRVEYLVFDLYRYALLANRLRKHNLEIDWAAF